MAQTVGNSATEIDAAIRHICTIARRGGRGFGRANIHAQYRGFYCDDPSCNRPAAIHECGHTTVAAVLGFGAMTGISLTRVGRFAHHRTDGLLGISRNGLLPATSSP